MDSVRPSTSRSATRFINDPIGITTELDVAYDDLGQAMRILRTAAREHPDLVAEPDPQVRVVELRGDDVLIRARRWLPQADRDGREAVRSTLIRQAKERLQAAGVEIGTATDLDVNGELAMRDVPSAE